MPQETLTAVLQLEIGAFTANLQTASQQVQQFAQSLNTQLQNATQAVQRTTQAITQQGQAAQQASRQVDAFGQVVRTALSVTLGQLGFASLQQAVTTLKTFAGEVVQAGVRLEGLRAAFTTVAASAQAGGRALNFARQEALRLGIDIDVAQDRFLKLSAAARGTTLEGGEVQRLFTAMAGASRVLNLSSEQTKLSFIALEQIMSKGKLSSEELRRQLGEHLPSAFQIAARAMGVTTSQLDDMLRKGQIMSDDFLPKFRRQLELEFGQGVERASQTAGAAFTRFFNEMALLKERLAGSGILDLLKGIADQIATLLRLDRQAAERAAQRQANAAATALAGQTVINAPAFEPPASASAAQAKRLQQLSAAISGLEDEKTAQFSLTKLPVVGERISAALDKRIAELQKEFKALNDAATATRGYTRELDLETRAEINAAEALDQSKQSRDKALDTVRKMRGELTQTLKTLEQNAQESPAIYDEPKRGLQDIVKAAKELDKELERHPFLRQERDVVAFRKELNALAQGYKDDKDAAKDAAKAENEAAREAKRALEQRKELVDSLVQGQKFVLRSPDIKDITADIAYFENQLKTSTGPQLEAIGAILANLYDAKQKAFGAIPDTFAQDNATVIEGLERINKELKDLDPTVEKVSKAFQKLVSLEGIDKFDELRSKAKVTFDELEQAFTGNEALIVRTRKAREREFAQISEQETKETQQELAKQQAEYHKFAKGIQDTLSQAFEGILNGSRSIFDSIKQLFIKLLADLAAAALTHAVIIPAIVQFFGSGSGGGSGGGGSAFGSLAAVVSGVSGAGGGTSGSGGGGTFGDILGLAQQGSNLYSSATSGGSLLGGGSGGNNSLLSLLSQNSTVRGILDTTIAGGTAAGTAAGASLGAGTSLTATTAPTLGAIGATGEGIAGGGAAALGSAGLTVGVALQGIAAGIAVGFTLSELNDLLGLKKLIGSRGSSALAGAGGGAVGGAIIGTAINPGFGTAVGAIIGTVVGALGGYLFGGSKTPKPQVDIKDVARPTVSYDTEFGLQTQGQFGIVSAPFRDIGKFNYGEFLGNINNAINDLFGQLLDGFRSLSPNVQKALVTPLNDIARQVEEDIEKTKFKGKNALADLENYFGTKLPEFINGLIRPLQEALQKIDPVAKAFEEVIDNANKILIQLAQQEASVILSIQEQIHALQEDLFSPAQVFLRRQDELAQVQAFIATASPQEKLAAVPQVQKLVNEIFALGKTDEVLGQDPQLVRDLQASSIQVLEDLQATTDQAFGTLGSEVQQQITLAEQQLDTLIASLGNLGSIDNVISESLPVLESIRGALAPYADQDALSTQIQTALTAASVQSLQNIDTTAQMQLAELQSINANIGGVAASPNIGNGSGGDDGGGNALGLGFVPKNAFYFLHQGEAVIPAHLNNGGQNGGNITVNINGSSGDPDAIATAVIAQIERKGGRLGNSRIMVSKR